MNDVKKLIKSELLGWKTWEVVWLLLACAAITGLSVYWGDTLMGIVSATSGVACVVCTGKGKLSAYAFGLVNSFLYAVISYQAKFYGEAMLNALYYVPMQFVGFFVWKRNMDESTNEVEKKRMTWSQRGVLTAVISGGTVAYGFVLKALGGAMPFVDAFTTVSSVVAMIVSVRMFAEQWYIWIAVDVMTVVMWAMAFAQGNDSIATLAMWAVYLGNAAIMAVKWEKEAKDREQSKV